MNFNVDRRKHTRIITNTSRFVRMLTNQHDNGWFILYTYTYLYIFFLLKIRARKLIKIPRNRSLWGALNCV